ncbi:hypothetical protein LEN26_016303 [Aphanomyces euteiches]|nr:hypothetical protein LEN26_016303 [Aphanomyces euteiches]
MDKLQSLDLSQFQNDAKDASEIALHICREMAWDPHQKIEASLLELLVDRISYSKLTRKTEQEDEKTTEKELVAHQGRGSSIQHVVKEVIPALHKPTAVDLISTAQLKARLTSLRNAFPGPMFNHAVAVKANPIRGVLRIAQSMGFGAECASFAEVHHALSLNFPPRSVVYDSPCKTAEELKTAIKLGCYINLDNVEEINKVQDLLTELYGSAALPSQHQGQIGLRINPVVGGGTIASTSTATSSSKFGLPWTPETESDLLEIYERHPWLQGVHVHVGSQGCAVDLLVAGAKRAVEFASLVNSRVNHRQIHVLDIGGGLPTVYDGLPHSDLQYTDYARLLSEQVPEVFSGEFFILTEFGRSVFVKSGITLTRVESVKRWSGQNIAVVHVGANHFLRTAYLPHMWPHTFSVFTASGTLKEGPLVKQDIAGPLCFSGDFLARGVWLPQIEPNDYIAIHDTGAYTVSMYSKYNSRPSTAVFGYDAAEDGAIQLTSFKPQETVEEVLAFWGS